MKGYVDKVLDVFQSVCGSCLDFELPEVGKISIGGSIDELEQRLRYTLGGDLADSYFWVDTYNNGIISVFFDQESRRITGLSGGMLQSILNKNLIFDCVGFQTFTRYCVDDYMLIFEYGTDICLGNVRIIPKGADHWKSGYIPPAPPAKEELELKASIDGIKKEIDALCHDFYIVSSRISAQKRKLDRLEEAKQNAETAYLCALTRLACSYHDDCSGYSLRDLESLGKVYKDEYGAYVLREGAYFEPFTTSEVEREIVELGLMERPQQGWIEIESTGDPTYITRYLVSQRKEVLHEDKAYKRAKWWVETRDPKLHQDVVNTFNELKKCSAELKEGTSAYNNWLYSAEHEKDEKEHKRLKTLIDEKRELLWSLTH